MRVILKLLDETLNQGQKQANISTVQAFNKTEQMSKFICNLGVAPHERAEHFPCIKGIHVSSAASEVRSPNRISDHRGCRLYWLVGPNRGCTCLMGHLSLPSTDFLHSEKLKVSPGVNLVFLYENGPS